MIRRPPRSPLFPCTTLFRSDRLSHRNRQAARPNAEATRAAASRSEEHTSELQSHLNLVCRLLLEKKKKTRKPDRAGRTLRVGGSRGREAWPRSTRRSTLRARPRLRRSSRRAARSLFFF